MIALLRSRDVRYLLCIVVFSMLLVLPALVQPSRLIYPSWSDLSDLTLIHWPKMLLIRQSLAEGHGWPLWSPYALSGQPLAANQLAMLFYPPALLLLLGPLAWSFGLFYALHLAWAGIGTYWLVRGLGRQPESALLAAAIFALSGKLAAHTAIGHASLMAAITWTPWAFAFLHRALARNSAPYAVLTGVTLAAQATTHTYALVFTAYGLLLYAAMYLLLTPGWRTGQVGSKSGWLRKSLACLALIPLTAALLGAAQLLPLAEMAPYSNRALSLEEATDFSLSPIQTLAGLLLPTPNVGHEWIIYPGLLTWGLAAGAWFARRERPVLIFAVLSLSGIVLAMGNYTPLYRVVHGLIPGLRWMRTPARIWFFVSLGLAVLASYGFEQWQGFWRRPARRTTRLLLVAGMGFALLLSIGVMLFLDQGGRGAWGLGVFGLLSGALLLWALRHRRTPIFAGLALLLLLTDLLSFDYTLLRFLTHDQLAAQGHSTAAWLASQPGTFRVYSPSYSLPQPAAAEAGLAQIDGVEPVHLADYDRFMARAGGYGEGPFSVTIPPFPEGTDIMTAHRDTVPDLRLLGLLNGRYLAAAFPLESPDLTVRWQGTNRYVFENAQVLPRAFVVYQVEPISHERVWDRLGTLDPARTALVENGMPLDGRGKPTPARVAEQSPNSLVVETELDAPGFLVLSEIWYPGWQAYDNGHEITIHRTDAVLRGVYLAAGSHTVEFRYSPWTVWAGLVIAAGTTLALLAYVGYVAWRRP
jgi:hypothetical protein